MNGSDAAFSTWHKRATAEDARILIVQRENIGDLVLSTPFFRALHEALPNARIDVVANSYNAAILDGNGAISNCYFYTKLKHRNPEQSWLGVVWHTLRMRATLRANHYDLAIVMGARLSRHGLRLAKAARPRQIAAFVSPADPSDQVHLPIDSTGVSQHPPRLHRFLLEKLVPPDHRGNLPQSLPSCEVTVDQKLRQALIDGEKLRDSDICIAFHISARKVNQRWSAENFGELMHRAYKTHGGRPLVLWAPGAPDDPAHPGDDEKAEELLALTTDLPVIVWPTQSLPALIAALSVAHVVVCSDGGAMHIAAALGKPLVCMFGNSDPNVWQAWATRQTILRDDSHTVAALSVDLVENALNAMTKSSA
jgi:heptosyltransferase III